MAELEIIVHHAVDLVLSSEPHNVVETLVVGSESGAMNFHIALSNRFELLLDCAAILGD